MNWSRRSSRYAVSFNFVPAGTGCRPLTAITAAPALVPQLTSNLAEGIYCVSVTDTGTLTRDMNFAIRVMHP